jgi:hypothetical protein
MVKVKDNYNINNKYDVKKSGNGWSSIMLGDDTRFWNLDQRYCYLTNRTKWEAKPSLRSCYSTSTNACCNFIQDANIDEQFGSLVPSSCTKSSFGEIKIFQCISCRAESLDYFIKANSSAAYFERAKKLFDVQKDKMDIKSQEFGEVL